MPNTAMRNISYIKVVFCQFAIILSSFTITLASSTDSLKIEVIKSLIKLDKSNHGISIKLDSPDKSIYSCIPENVYISISSEMNSCMTTNQWQPENDVTKKETYRSFAPRIYVFMYDDENTRIYPEYPFTCDRFYLDFNTLLKQGILKICLLDYALSTGKYRLKLIYYSVELDQCLPSNIVEFTVGK